MSDDFQIGQSSFRKTNKQKGINSHSDNVKFDNILNNVLDEGDSKKVALDKINSAVNPEEFMELVQELINETLKDKRGPERTTSSYYS